MWIRNWHPGKAGGARTAAVWLTAGALALGACGGADTDDPPSSQTSRAAASAPAEQEAEGAEAVSAASEPADTNAEEPEDGAAEGGPESLSDYLGFDFQDPDAAAAQFAEAERRAQEIIALCMAREGFEYIPVNPANTQGAVQVIGDDSEEYAREYGFGITTRYGSEEPDGRGSGTEDPNRAIQAAMSESERAAYMEALYGPPVADDEGAAAFEGEEIFGSGCQGGAYQEVQGRLIRMMQLLGPSLQELGERIQADPRVAEAEEGWSACMADRGYRYETQDEMYTEVFTDFGERLDEIIGPGGGAVDPFEGWTEEEVEIFLAENSEQAIEDFYEQAQSEARAGVDQEALAALQQEERDLATANAECGQDLLAVYDEVWPEYEQGFIDENREQLAQVRDG